MLYEILGGTAQADREREVLVAIRRRRLLESGEPEKRRAPAAPTPAEPRQRDGRLPAAL